MLLKLRRVEPFGPERAVFVKTNPNLEKILCRNLVKLLRMISIIYLEATQLSLDLLRKEQKLLFLDFSIHVNCENWQNLREKRYNWKNFEI